ERAEDRERKPPQGLRLRANEEEAGEQPEKSCEGDRGQEQADLYEGEDVKIARVVGMARGDFGIDEAGEKSAGHQCDGDERGQEEGEGGLFLHSLNDDRGGGGA